MKMTLIVEIETSGEHPQNMINDVLSYYRIAKSERHQINGTTVEFLDARIEKVA